MRGRAVFSVVFGGKNVAVTAALMRAHLLFRAEQMPVRSRFGIEERLFDADAAGKAYLFFGYMLSPEKRYQSLYKPHPQQRSIPATAPTTA